MRYLIGFVCLAVFTTHVTADAEEGRKINWVVGASWGLTTLGFDEKLDADTTFDMYHLSVASSIGRAYAGINYSDSIRSENISEEDELGSATRRDVDFTVGYRITDNWAAFIGYKDGRTDIDFTVRDSDVAQDERYAEKGFYIGGSYSHQFSSAGTLSFTAAYISSL